MLNAINYKINTMRPWLRYVLIGLAVFLVVGQFIRPNRTVEAAAPEQDYLAIAQPPAPIAETIKSACYDCHSNTSKYPWYAEVAPVSWWIQSHINGGRQKLNFSAFGSYSTKKAAHKIEECFEEVEKKVMPLKSYTWLHPEAQLSEEERSALVGWFKQDYAKREE